MTPEPQPNDASQTGGGVVQRLVRALRDLFRNPMPHDLITIRREVERDYGGDEESAKEEMEAWCSQEYMEQQIAAHREAWHNAADVLREYGPNARSADARDNNQPTATHAD